MHPFRPSVRRAAAGLVLALALACSDDAGTPRAAAPPADTTAGTTAGATSLTESAPAPSDGSCRTLADDLRRQFGIVELEAQCVERTAHVEIVDPTLTSTLARETDSLAATEAAAEIIARSVWTRAGRPAALTAVMVTISPLAIDSAPNTVVNSFGRAALAGWTPAAKDTTERCLTRACR